MATSTSWPSWGPREHLCVSAVLERAEYLATAQVVSERAEILRVDAAAVCERLEHDAGFADALGRVLLEQTRRQFEKIRVMSARSVTQRLATLLLVLDERFGVPDAEGVRIPVPLSRGDLAAFIGARVETTIRCIRRWERAGVLTTTSGGIVLRELAVIRAAVRAAPTGGDRSDDPARSA